MLFLWLAPVFSGWSQEAADQDYVIRVWGADDGLTEGSVTDVAQTPEGYLWVGTLFGSVLRFDGMRFVSYNSANTPEYSFKWGVPHFMTGRDGTLWISMVDGGLSSWDRHGFRSIFTGTNQPERILWSATDRAIFVFGGNKLLVCRKSDDLWSWHTNSLPGIAAQGQQCADADGRIWYLQAGNRLGIWAETASNSIMLPDEMAGQAIKVLTADNGGRIWIGTDRSLAIWQTNHFEIMTPTNGEPMLNVKRIVPSGTTNIWVEANNRMRCCVGRQWQAESPGWSQELGRRTNLRFLHGDSAGGLWSGVADLGLVHVAPDGAYRRLTTRDGLPSNIVHFAYEDRDGNIWTGYERGGLVQIRRRLLQNISKEDGLGDSLVNTVTEDPGGAIWIGTHSGVVGRFQAGVCTNFALPGTASMQDSCAVADASGRIWIGAQNLGLMVSEGGQGRVIATQGQLQGYPRLLFAARDGTLWVGTLWSLISVTNGQIAFRYVAQTVGGHPTALTQAADGTIWAGTLGGDLMHWDGSKFITLEPPDKDLLGRIWALWPAPDGSLWAGTEEGGLLHWNNGHFYRYTMKNGLPSDSIAQIQGDAGGNLWLATRTGIARIFGASIARFERGEIGTLAVSVYGHPDGLLTIGSAIIDQPNCWHGHDGTLYFAMANSVTCVRPGQVHVNPLPPTVALEEMVSDDQPVWPERAGAILTAAENPDVSDPHVLPPVIRLGPGRGDLEFHYTGLSLASPLRVRFRYKLEGLENSWNDAGTERKAIYRHVPPGEYTFRVTACNSDGVFSTENEMLTVVVQPHFYQTAWFRLGVGVLLLTGMSLAIAVSMRQRLRRRMEQLERQHELERERSRIAQDLHDDLGAGLTEIGLLGGLLQDPAKLPSRRQEALDRIVRRCHDLVMGLDEIVWAVNPRNDSVNSLGGYLSRYAQNFLEPTNIRCRLEAQEIEPDQPLNSEQRHNLFLAFEEALTNVVRHSGATEVRIKFSVEAGRSLMIAIDDNGRGLPPTVDQNADGLINLRGRMKQIGGECQINSVQAGGNSVPAGGNSVQAGGVSIRLILPLGHRKKPAPDRTKKYKNTD